MIKKEYLPPQVYSFPVEIECNFCESVNGGAGLPGYEKDSYTPVWG